MLRWAVAAFVCALTTMSALAGSVQPREGWKVFDTKLTFTTLVQKLDAAVKSNKMAIVTVASASDGAKAQGFSIAGNRVVGVYRNDFARRMLQASIAAGIEAPIRFYVTEDPDGTATLSYKTPTAVFTPYFAESSDLPPLAQELDAIFDKIAETATRSD
jgi:uncharacterized protein (DUF302 family)